MARSRWTDFLQDHLFWAMDISGVKQIPVFTPFFGFSSISAPRIQVEVETFKDGTYIYPRHVVKGASVGSVTFQRAAAIYDSDFYDWIYYAIYGTNYAKDQGLGSSISNFLGDARGPIRRNILLIHFARINANGNEFLKIAASEAFGALVGAVAGGAPGALAGAAVGAGAAFFGQGLGPMSVAAWLPARAWILHDCIPINYISGGDFDAASGEVSLMQLEVQPEWIEEFSMGIRP